MYKPVLKLFFPATRKSPAARFFSKCIAVAFAMMLTTIATRATDYTVENLNDIGAGSLRAAIISANADAGADVIIFKPGLSGTIVLNSMLNITESVTINGNGSITLSGQSSTAIMEITDNTATLQNVIIRGINFTAGKLGAVGTGGASFGGDYVVTALYGGINCRENLTMEQVTVSSCQGGIFFGAKAAAVAQPSLTLTNVKFLDNTHRYAVATPANTATNQYVGAVTMNYCVFDNNTMGAGTTGGGASLYATSVSIKNSSFTRNSGSTSSQGAALILRDGNSKMSSVLVENCTFAYNFNTNPPNQSTGGGAIWIYFINNAATFNFNNCTIWGNTYRNVSAQAVYQLSYQGTNTMNFKNCIIGGSSDGYDFGSATSGSQSYTANFTNCLIGTSFSQSGTNNFTSCTTLPLASPGNAKLASSAEYNGGFVKTVAFTDGTSPAINLGTTGSGIPTVDGRGFFRDGVSGKNDAGAYERGGNTFEFNGTTLPVNNTTNASTSGNLVIDYGSTIAKGSGSITVKNNATSATTNINVSSSNVTISGSQVSITAGALSPGVSYTVTAPAGVFTATFDGATATSTTIGSTSFTFTTEASSAPTNSAPTNSVLPSISGTTQVGNALSTTTGTWTDAEGNTLAYSYQWHRADDASGTNSAAISSATTASYTLTTSEAHKYVRVAVTANDGNGGTTAANSAWTAITNSAPLNSVAPSVSGTASVGNALSSTNGSWTDADGDSRTYSYQWYRADDASGTNAVAISSANTSSYTLTASDAGKYVRVVVTADDANGGSVTANSSWTQVTGVTITLTPTSLTNATVATSYSQSITASGGTASYTFAITAGALPPGLTLTTGGTLSGTPTAGGSFNFTITATDASSFTGARAYSLTVDVPTITIVPMSLPSATQGSAYSQSITASGGTTSYSYAITAGVLPAGLTLANGGTLSGTPTVSGTFNFTVTATDASTGSGPYTGSRAYSLAVTANDATLSNLSLSAGATLNPTFASATTSYTSTVGVATTAITVTPTVNQSGATVTVNGNAVTSGNASGNIALNIGSNTITVVATAQDGITTKTYTINITRNDYTTPTNPSTGVSFSGVSFTTATASWTVPISGGGTSRAVFIKASNTGTPSPVNNTTYTANTVFGSGTQIGTSGWYCIYNGTGNSVNITGLSEGTTYRVNVVEYNGTVGLEKYSPATGSNNPNNFTTTTSNTAPTNIALSATSINENVLAGSTIGTLSTTDAQGGTMTYTLVTGTGDTDNASFIIYGSSLNINASPDFETKSSYSVRVRTTDAGSLSFEKQFTITINNTNDAPTLSGGPYTFTATTIGNQSVEVSVSSLLSALTHGDQDAGAVKGIIVTGVSETGHWQFAQGGSSDWINAPSRPVSATNGVLLKASDRIFYMPGPGAETATITFRAWDQTAFTPASVPGDVKLANPSTNGGTTSFSSGTATASIQVNKVAQTITFNALSAATYGDADISLTATASSSQPVTYESGNTAIATIVSGKIHILKAGTVDIIAKQGGNGTYMAAPDVTRSLTINKKSIDAYIDNSTPITKVYDAATSATLVAANYVLDGVVGTDVITVSGTAAYTTKTVGNNKLINVSSLALAGADKDNYTLSATTTTTSGSITKRDVTVTLNSTPSITKIYNGTSAATLAAGNYTLTGKQGTDALTVTGTATYDTKSVGTGKTVTVNTFVLAGTDKDNYNLATTSATTTGSITAYPLTLTLNSTPAISKVYDRGATAALASANYNLSGVQGSDVVTVSGTATYDNKNVGTAKTITANTFVLAGADKDNYSLSTTSATTTGEITKKDITVTIDNTPTVTKVYSGDASAVLAAGNYNLNGVISPDAVTVTGTASYDTKLAGTGKTVTATSFVLAGGDKDNYNLITTSATTTGSITAYPLTLTLNSTPAISKVYDGTASATLAPGNYNLLGVQGSDNVNVSGTATYNNKSVGTGKTITTNSLVLMGADKDNYSLLTTSATTTGAITKKDITLALNATPTITKVYDAGTSATLNAGNYSLTGVVSPDAVTVSGTANYDNKTVATGKTVTASSFVLAGADKDNYNLTTTFATTLGSVTKKDISLALNNSPTIVKLYDGTTSATLSAGNYSLTGIVTSDVVTVSGTASYDNKLAGSGKTITVNNFALAGADKDNYSLATTSATTTGIIAARPVSVTLNAAPTITKVYDAGTSATLAPNNYSLSNIQGSDVVTVTGTATYDTKAAGTGKTVTVNALVLAGADKDNYTLMTTSTSTTGTITKRDVTLALNATPTIAKIYDGSTAAALATGNYSLTGLQGADALTVTGTATYDTKLVGTGKTVTASSFLLTGADKDNYNLSTTSATTTGTITAYPLTLTLNNTPAITKSYDASTSATLMSENYTLNGVKGMDEVTVSGTATYQSKNVGTAKTVSVNNFVLDGADKDNYTLSITSATTTGSITARTLEIVINSTPIITKTYDATPLATLAPANYTLNGILASDIVTVSGTANYDDKMVGTDKVITVGSFVLAGPDKDNYNILTSSGTTTGNITQKVISVSLLPTPLVTKVYDNTNVAVLVGSNFNIVGKVNGDDITATGTATYANELVGTGKTVTAANFSLRGNDAANYNLTTTSATTTGDITKKPLTLSLLATPLITKTYDKTNTAVLTSENYTISGAITGDVVTVSGVATYADGKAGVGKVVTATGFVLGGEDKDNYSLTTTTANTTGNITTKALTAALTGIITKTYDNSTTASLAPANYLLPGVLANDIVTLNNPNTGTYDTKQVGVGKNVMVTGLAISGADAANYNLTATTANATLGAITARPLTATLTGTTTKVYDATTNAILTSANYTLPGVLGSDVVTLSYPTTGTYENKQVGTGKMVSATGLTITGADATNYNLTSSTVNANVGTITGKTLTASLTGTVSKVYNGTTTAALTGTNYSVSGIVGNDIVILNNPIAGTYDNRFVGTAKTVAVAGLAVSGADAANYSLASTSASAAIGVITKKDLTLTLLSAPALTKVYDGTTGISLAAGNYLLNGVETVDAGEVAVNGTATFVNKDAGNNKIVNATGFILAGAQAANYALITTSTSTTGTITQKPLTITADNKEKFQGLPLPTFTASYSGFISGENNTVLTVQPSFSTTATATSPQGSYPISVTGAQAQNYAINYSPGVLTVKPGSPTNIALTAQLLLENAATGAVAGNLTSTSDDPSAIFTYSLVGGNGDTDNASFTVSGNQLRTNAVLNYETKTSYNVRIRSTTQYGLSLDKEFVINLIDVNEVPTLNAISNQTICFTSAQQIVSLSGISAGPDAGQTITTTVSATNNGLFSNLSITQPNGGNAQIRYTPAAGANGTATLTVTVRDNGGTTNGGVDTFTRTFTITVNALPVPAIISSVGNSISKGATGILTASGGTSYQWQNAAGILAGQNSAVLTVRPSETTTYRVTVTNASGCQQTLDYTIEVQNDYQLIAGTNILTPNGDGKNDNLIIRNLDMYPNNELTIFDRAGRLLYSKKNYDNSWNGTFNGLPLAEGTYYYIINFGSGVGAKKGFVSIVRD